LFKIGVTQHHASIGIAFRKLIDIKANIENSNLKVLAVKDDRIDAQGEKGRPGLGITCQGLKNDLPIAAIEDFR